MFLVSATIMLVLILNPLGNIPIFLTELKSVDPKRHTAIIVREIFFAFLLLICFGFFGGYILHGFAISEQALGISGGIIIFIIALRLIFPEAKPQEAKQITSEPFIVPLAIPISAGPGALVTAMLLGTQHPDKKIILFFAIALATLICCVILLGGRYLSKYLGEKVLIALERLFGMMLTGMAVQMFLTGIDSYFRMH